MSVGAVNKSTGDRIPTAGIPAIDDALDMTSVNPVQNAIVTAALANKQDKTDNSLQTTDKTVVGAINEHEGDIDSLKSGLTNYETQNDLNLEVPTRKNLIPMTVDAIKAANTTGIWSGDSYTLNGVTMAIQKDTDGNVEGVKLTGNNTLGSSFYLYVCPFTCKAGQKYYMNGCPEGGGVSSYLLSISGSYPDTGSGSTINPFSTDATISVRITIGNGYDFGSGGKIFNPMIRLATITDPTFAPYIPSVESRIEAVESAIKTYTSNPQLSTQGAETLCQITVDVDPTKYMWMASINSGDGDDYVSFLTISAIYTQSNNKVIVVISQKARDSYSSSYINVNLVGIRKG